MPGIEKEIIVFAAALFAGAGVRLFYRCLELFREIVKHSSAAIGAEDMLFWVGAAFYLFVQIYQTNSGSIRWYFILGVVVGAIFMSFFVRKIKKFRRFFGRKNVDKLQEKR